MPSFDAMVVLTNTQSISLLKEKAIASTAIVDDEFYGAGIKSLCFERYSSGSRTICQEMRVSGGIFY